MSNRLMDSKDIRLVSESWKRIEPHSDQAGKYFFKRLFEMDPTFIALFKDNEEIQQRQYVNMLNIIVNGLEQVDSLKDALNQLGKKHQGYGATRSHFETMSECLIVTIEHYSENELNVDEKRAWHNAFHMFSNIMLDE